MNRFVFLFLLGVFWPLSAHAGVETAVAFYEQLRGQWVGSNSLWLRPGTPVHESDIKATISAAANGHYYLMNYSWSFEGEVQEGVFFLGGNENMATATWGDSWHMAPEPMYCQGELKENGARLVLIGTFTAGEGPDWGWRTEFTRQGPDNFLMEAYVIPPTGEEGLAVRAELKRTGR